MNTNTLSARAACRWQARGFRFDFPRPALVMGVLNVTPDSFYDGGSYVGLEAAVARGLAMVREGAEVIDVGGESTRPGAVPVPAEEELARVIPVIRRLVLETAVPVSIDTQKESVAAAALEAGASVVNDVAAAEREDGGLWSRVAASGAGYVCMHRQGTPQTMQEHPTYVDVVAEVEAFFRDRLARLGAAGVRSDQVVFDVGIGFGKTVGHNLKLLRALDRFTTLHRPQMLGVSRKSFMGTLLGAGAGARLPASLACACWAIRHGVQILRVHDVSETVQAVRMTEALQAGDDGPDNPIAE